MNDAPAQQGHEAYEQRARPIVYGILFVAALIIISATAVAGLFAFYRYSTDADKRPASPFAEMSQRPPDPKLQANPARDMAEFRRRETELLTTYGWVDRERGIVRIPIERAMELTAREAQP